MIFVTVGTQLPFPRLIDVMNHWSARNPGTEVIAQTCDAAVEARHLKTRERLDAVEFRATVERCDLLVAHAGMGSILTALDLGKPVIIMPRQARLGEHRNDHQRATAEKFGHLANLRIVHDAAEFDTAIEAIRAESSEARDAAPASAGARRLIREVRSFVFGGAKGTVLARADLPGEPSHGGA